MLEYFKTILEKVSFDRILFEKELKKALKSLIPDEILMLRDWCFARFGQEHRPILLSVFKN